MKPASGKELKEIGQQVALANAGAEWTADMLVKLRAFCKVRKNLNRGMFRMEEFRAVALIRQWPLPPTSKAWGGLASAAAKANIIRSTGEYDKAQSKATHAHPVLIWQAL